MIETNRESQQKFSSILIALQNSLSRCIAAQFCIIVTFIFLDLTSALIAVFDSAFCLTHRFAIKLFKFVCVCFFFCFKKNTLPMFLSKCSRCSAQAVLHRLELNL